MDAREQASFAAAIGRQPLRILILEDSTIDAELIRHALKKAGVDFVTERVEHRADFVAALETFRPDVALCDYTLPDFTGADALAHVRQAHPEIPVVMVTGTLGDERAIELLKAGAKDYVLKSNLVRLPSAVARAISVERGIRARKAAERALRESNKLLATTERIAHIGGWHWDTAGEAVVWSEELYRIFGRDPAELQPTIPSFLAAVHPDDRAGIEQAIAASVEQGASFDVEFRIVRPDGNLRIAATGAELLRDAGGRIVAMDGTCHDVTETRLAEQKIREEEAKFSGLVEQNVAGVAIVRDDGTIGYVNPYFAGLVGCEPAALLGRPLLDIVPDSEKAIAAERLASQFAPGGGFIQIETKMQAKDGRELDILVNASPGIFEGKPASISVVMDISERKRAAEDLRISEERFRLVIEQAPDAIVVYDYDRNRFVEANKTAERLFGCGRDELLQYGPPHFYANEQPDRLPLADSFAEHNRRVLAGEELRYERRILNAVGEERLCEVTLIRLPSPGARLMRASFVDVTDRRRAEQTLQRLNRSLRTLSRGNEVVVRASNEDALMTDMCRTIVEAGGYRMAWIGKVERDAAKSVTPVAWAGEIGSYLEQAHITWAEEPRGNGPHGRAIRSGVPQITQDLTGDPSMAPWREAAARCGFASSIVLPLKNAEVFGVLMIYAGETDAFDDGALKLLQEMADDLSYGVRALHDRVERDTAVSRWETSLDATIEAIAATVDMRDPYTAGHQRRVAQLAVAIARKLALPEDQIHGLRLAGVIHDVGKVTTPAEILNKPGKLSPLEFQLIQSHVQGGYDIIKGVDFPWPIAEIVRQHHERLDGSGYPRGLRGEEILQEARILAVADVVEAMMSHRPYRPALGLKAALAEVKKGKGTHYDPVAVDACIALFHHGFRLD